MVITNVSMKLSKFVVNAQVCLTCGSTHSVETYTPPHTYTHTCTHTYTHTHTHTHIHMHTHAYIRNFLSFIEIWKMILEKTELSKYHIRVADVILSKISEQMWLKEQVFKEVGIGEQAEREREE